MNLSLELWAWTKKTNTCQSLTFQSFRHIELSEARSRKKKREKAATTVGGEVGSYSSSSGERQLVAFSRDDASRTLCILYVYIDMHVCIDVYISLRGSLDPPRISVHHYYSIHSYVSVLSVVPSDDKCAATVCEKYFFYITNTILFVFNDNLNE